MSSRKSKTKHLDTRVSEEWIEWLEGQIKTHSIPLNKSELVIEAVEKYFEQKGMDDFSIPTALVERVDEFLGARSTKANRSLLVTAALIDYLDRH